jgi:hypothetical protein
MKLEQIVRELQLIENRVREESDKYHDRELISRADKLGVLADYVKKARLELDVVADSIARNFPNTLSHL